MKNLERIILNTKNEDDGFDLTSDMRYIRKSCALITEALQKGGDVLQMPNGDIIITETRTVTFQYTWDDKKGKMVRVQSGGRLRKTRQKKGDPAITGDIESYAEAEGESQFQDTQESIIENADTLEEVL